MTPSNASRPAPTRCQCWTPSRPSRRLRLCGAATTTAFSPRALSRALTVKELRHERYPAGHGRSPSSHHHPSQQRSVANQRRCRTRGAESFVLKRRSGARASTPCVAVTTMTPPSSASRAPTPRPRRGSCTCGPGTTTRPWPVHEPRPLASASGSPYGYAAGDPLNPADPSGLMPGWVKSAAAAGVVIVVVTVLAWAAGLVGASAVAGEAGVGATAGVGSSALAAEVATGSGDAICLAYRVRASRRWPRTSARGPLCSRPTSEWHSLKPCVTRRRGSSSNSRARRIHSRRANHERH